MAKNDAAGRRRKPALPAQDAISADPSAGTDAAFDVWLNRGLHQLYDTVAREPIPDELLNIIEADRAQSRVTDSAKPTAAGSAGLNAPGAPAIATPNKNPSDI